MICEDESRFQICYDYVKGIKPLYDKTNSVVWIPFYRPLNKGMWGFPDIDHNGVYEVPMNLIDPFYLKRYINRKLAMFNKKVTGTVYIPFCFFAERLSVGILLERRSDHEHNVNDSMLPPFLEDFKEIFPQKEKITFC